MSASDWANLDELNERAEDDMTTTKDALPELPEAFVPDWPDYHSEAMGCGLEDRGIHDRYEAMYHGWDCAISRAAEAVPDGLYTASQMRAYALAALASKQAPTNEWRDLFWRVAKELNCLPSTFVDANAHVIRKAKELAQAKSEPAALTDAQLDALMPEHFSDAWLFGESHQVFVRWQVRASMRAAIAATQEQKP